MAKYDFTKAKRFIQMHSDHIESASLGMEEDWAWTAETVYEDGRFVIDLDEVKEVAGISGSNWATPSLYVQYKNGIEEMKPCHIGDVGGVTPEWFELGCISSQTQEWVESVKRPKLTN